MTTATKAPAATSLVDNLIDIGTIVDRVFELRMRDLKLSTAQARILEALDVERRECGNGLQPRTLAAILIQAPHSVSGLLNRLEDRDLVTRTRDRQDRRVVWAKLTEAGIEAVDGVAQERRDLEARVSAELGLTIDTPLGTSLAWRDGLCDLMPALSVPVGR